MFTQLVVLLYLIDNNENTSWMILLGSGTGVAIEAWKVRRFMPELEDRGHSHPASYAQITKAVDIVLAPAPAGSVLPWKIEIKGTIFPVNRTRRL